MIAMIKKILIGIFLISVLFTGYIAFDSNSIEAEKMALVQEAKIKADEAVQRRANEFTAFIHAKKVGAKPFSLDVIGLNGIWNAGKCQFPGKDDDCYKKYIAEKFSEHIFTPEDFGRAMNRSIAGGVQDIETIENQLAVSLQKVILGRSLTPTELPLAESEFKRTIEVARSASNDAVLKETGGLVVTEVVTQILSQVLLRMGVAAGIWTLGGANSGWTLGGSLVLAVVASAIWDFFAHPAEDIEKGMLIELDKVSSSGSAAIKDELTKKVSARSQLWEKTVKETHQ
jgi:hypothetical protein